MSPSSSGSIAGKPSRTALISIENELPACVPAYPMRLDRRGRIACVTSPARIIAQFLGMTRDLDGLPGFPELRDPCDAATASAGRGRVDLHAVAEAITLLFNRNGVSATCRIQANSLETDEIVVFGFSSGNRWELQIAPVERGTQFVLEVAPTGENER